MTDSEDEEHAHVFSADFNLAFLARFDFPTLAPQASVAPVSIRHTTLRFRPYRTFYSRLVALILPEMQASHGGKPKEEADGEGVSKRNGSGRGEDGIHQTTQEAPDDVPMQQTEHEEVQTSTVALSA